MVKKEQLHSPDSYHGNYCAFFMDECALLSEQGKPAGHVLHTRRLQFSLKRLLSYFQAKWNIKTSTCFITIHLNKTYIPLFRKYNAFIVVACVCYFAHMMKCGH